LPELTLEFPFMPNPAPPILAQFEQALVKSAISDTPKTPFSYPTAAQCGIAYIPHLSIFLISQLWLLCGSDEEYKRVVPDTVPFHERVPRLAGITLPVLPAMGAEDTHFSSDQAKAIATWVCSSVFKMVDFAYGNKGFGIDHNSQPDLLHAIGILPAVDIGFLDTEGDELDRFVLGAEAVMILLSRYARSAAAMMQLISNDISLPTNVDKQRRYSSVLYFPDLKHHNSAHYPPIFVCLFVCLGGE
jgi:hypothetical protein